MSQPKWSHARAAYDQLAPHYDGLTEGYDHRTWLARLLQLAGATGNRVLDLACGTGKSFAPLIGCGYDISACDISPEMLGVARRRFGLSARRSFLADMRRLPDCGRFDVITCLDDAVNYLRSPSELLAAFTGAARQLSDDGVFVFDTNTLRTYRTAFAGSYDISSNGDAFRWRGLGSESAAPGSQATAVVERLGGAAPVPIATHSQRHFPIGEVVELLAAAGLVTETIAGQRTGCRLHRRPDDLAETKTVFVARESR
jgi:SAM-dependent methyltransferase